MTFHFFALAALGDGVSGGDRIFIEFARNWASSGHHINIYVWKEGLNITKNFNLRHKNIQFHIVDMGIWPQFGFLVNYFARIILGIKLGLTLSTRSTDYLYSASDFWMDAFPALIVKLKSNKNIWIAGWYQTAPNLPFYFRALLYKFSQIVIKPWIDKFADYIFINNEDERKHFNNRRDRGLFVVLGAVDLEQINKYKEKHRHQIKKWDAVYQGRFHPQKGVLELVDIWGEVVKKNSKLKLVMIGDGELMPQVKNKINDLGLKNNIFLKGFLYEGETKYQILSESKVVLHPARFDSGGMATAEAMAFGVPAVGFDLESYESYYPKGMLKVEKNNIHKFSEAIIDLLNNKKMYHKYSVQAVEQVGGSWSWNYRARQVLDYIIKND